MKLYLSVTADEYELPLKVFDSGSELARSEGLKPDTLYSAITNKKNGNRKGVKYIKVEVEDD